MHEMMGKIVIVHKTLKRAYHINKRWWKSQEAEGRPGWVVGERWLQEGYVTRDYDYGSCWTQMTGSNHCLLVAYWPTMKPVKVPDDGYEPALPTVYPYQTPQPWPQNHRDYMRKEMAEWPRALNGRWVRKEK